MRYFFISLKSFIKIIRYFHWAKEILYYSEVAQYCLDNIITLIYLRNFFRIQMKKELIKLYENVNKSGLSKGLDYIKMFDLKTFTQVISKLYLKRSSQPQLTRSGGQTLYN